LVTKGSNDKKDWIQTGWSIDVLILELILSLEPSCSDISWFAQACDAVTIAAETRVTIGITGAAGTFLSSPVSLCFLEGFESDPVDSIPPSTSTGSHAEALGYSHGRGHVIGAIYGIARDIHLWRTSSNSQQAFCPNGVFMGSVCTTASSASLGTSQLVVLIWVGAIEYSHLHYLDIFLPEM